RRLGVGRRRDDVEGVGRVGVVVDGGGPRPGGRPGGGTRRGRRRRRGQHRLVASGRGAGGGGDEPRRHPRQKGEQVAAPGLPAVGLVGVVVERHRHAPPFELLRQRQRL